MSDEDITTDVKQEDGTKVDNNDTRPAYRFNEVVAERNDLREQLAILKSQEGDAKKAKLQEDEKWQELNSTLQKEVESYKPYQEKYEALDKTIREDALSRLSESKQEKFKNLSTSDLLNVVDELSAKPNPPDGAGTVDTKISQDAWKEMDMNQKRSNWSAILDSYKR